MHDAAFNGCLFLEIWRNRGQRDNGRLRFEAKGFWLRHVQRPQGYRQPIQRQGALDRRQSSRVQTGCAQRVEEVNWLSCDSKA